MGRWLATIVGIILAAAAGYIVGHRRSSSQPASAQHLETRLEEARSELTNVREQKQELQQRLEQVTKEQERLAQENEILRKQQTTDRLLSGQGGELPERPPK